MADGGFAFAIILCGYGWLTTIMYIVCMQYVAKYMNESLLNVDYNFDSIRQVSRDWLVQPFVEIIVTDKNYCPSSHPDLVFYRTFLGSNVGCDCFGIYETWIEANSFTNGLPCGLAEKAEGCR